MNLVFRCYFSFLVIFLFPNELPAQPNKATFRYADSLLRIAQQAPMDSVKIQRYLDLSFFWSDRDTTRAYACIEEARKLMGRLPTDYQKGLLHHFTANVIYGHDIQKAKQEYMVADRYFSRCRFPGAYYYRSKAWNNYGILLQMQDSAHLFMDIIIDKALPYSRLAGDSIAVGNHLQNIGLLLTNIQDYEKAESYYLQAIHTLANKPMAHEDRLTAFVNAGKNFLLARKYPQARTYLDSAATTLPFIPHSFYASSYYRSEGSWYRHMKQKDMALQHFQRGIAAARALDDQFMLRDIHFEIYAMYRDLGEYANAKKHLTIANQYEPFSNTHNRLLHIREMAKVEYKLGNYIAAYEQMEAYALGKDTLQENNMAGKILDLEKKYQTIEKANQILKLQDINQKQLLAIANSRWWILASGAFFLLSLSVAYFYRQRVRHNKKELEQSQKLHQEELKSIRQQERLKQYDSMLQGQELERNRLARDLHDGLGGLLAGVKLKLSSIVAKEGGSIGRSNDAVTEVIRQLDHSVNELRRISRNLMPEALLYMGLEPALSDLCKYMDSPKMTVTFQPLELKNTYPSPLLIAVYHISQELLTNALKHSNATQVILQCNELDGWLFITVEDNGNGMNIEKAFLSHGLGLTNIKSRVELLNGTIEILARPNEGTTINIQIPL